MKNNKGFTLIEALAVIVVLGLVLAIGGYSVANYLNKAREDSLGVFKENIKSGMINYYNECRYLSVNDSICKIEDEFVISGNKLDTTIGKLAEYGFLENQGSEEDGSTLIIKNPVTDEDITSCKVSITYNKDNQEFGVATYSAPEGMENTNVCTSLNS